MKNLSLFIISLFAIALNPLSAMSKKLDEQKGQKIVLVLGSGGSRGLAHVGVIEELEKMGIVPDAIVGCSSGAIVGALYAQHQDIAAVKELLINLTQEDLVDFSIFQKYAFSTRSKMEKFLEKNLTVTHFESLKIPFVAVATDLDKGEPVYFQEGEVSPAVLASAALPALFPPYKMGGRVYVDGGVCDPLPVHFARSLAENTLVIASDISPSLDGFDAENLPQVVRKAFEIVYQRLAYSSQQEADILLMMNFLNLDSPIADGVNHEIYQRGKEALLSQAEEIKKMVQ